MLIASRPGAWANAGIASTAASGNEISVLLRILFSRGSHSRASLRSRCNSSTSTVALAFLGQQVAVEALRRVQEVLGDSIVIRVFVRHGADAAAIQAEDGGAGERQEHRRVRGYDELRHAWSREAVQYPEECELALGREGGLRLIE